MRIVFLCYINRSGSTFLSEQLSRFKDVLVCPEADILSNELLVRPSDKHKNANQLVKKFLTDSKFKHWNLNIEEPLESNRTNFDFFWSILDSYRKKNKPHAHTIVFKAERLFELKNGIDNLGQNSIKIEFIYLIRDIRAVYNSQLNSINPITLKPFNINPVKTALYWNSFAKTAINNSSKNCHIIYYEELIKEYPNSIFQLLKELGVNQKTFYQEEGEIFKNLPDNYKVIHANIRKEALVERIADWQNSLSKRTIKALEITSGKYLSQLGYQLMEGKSRNLGLSLRVNTVVFAFKIKRYTTKIIYHIRRLFHV